MVTGSAFNGMVFARYGQAIDRVSNLEWIISQKADPGPSSRYFQECPDHAL